MAGLVLAAVVASGCAGEVVTGTNEAPSGPAPASARTQAPPTAGHAAAPESVRIPEIGVESALLHLGIAPDGSAEVPEDYARAGWFADSGATGVTVLLGHVDSRSGPAVFYRLRELRAGDRVEIERSDGSLATYAVERTEQVAKDEFPTFAVFGASPDDVLRLVTCAGEFDRGARSYVDNLVVHARRIHGTP